MLRAQNLIARQRRRKIEAGNFMKQHLVLLPVLVLALAVGCTEAATGGANAADGGAADSAADSAPAPGPLDGAAPPPSDGGVAEAAPDSGAPDTGSVDIADNTWTLGTTLYKGTLKNCQVAFNNVYAMTQYTGHPNEEILVHLPALPTTDGSYTLVMSGNMLSATQAHIGMYVMGAAGAESWDSTGGTISVTVNGTMQTATFKDVPMARGGAPMASTSSGKIICP
jgi:hypothetical protein